MRKRRKREREPRTAPVAIQSARSASEGDRSEAGGVGGERAQGGAAAPRDRVLSLQATHGNRHVQRLLRSTPATDAKTPGAGPDGPHPPAIGPGSQIVMKGDVNRIVSLLKQQWLSADDERAIVEIIARWSASDDAWAAESGYQGTHFLDKFLFLLKTRAYTRKNVRTAWIPHTSSPFDDLYYDLEDDRLDDFVALVGTSQKQSEPGPLGEQAENIWATLGQQEAIGLFGMLKGMGTGAAGLTDAGAWALTKSMQLAGIPIDDPPSAADWLADQYDITGEFFFGAEWAEGEDLIGGLSAADIGTGGGKIIWALTMAGAGGQAEAAGAADTVSTLKVFSFFGNLKGVEGAGQRIADRLLALMDEDKLTVGEAISDAELWQAATSLAASAFGAVTFAQTDEGEVAQALQEQLSRIGVLLDVAELAAAVGRVIEVGASDMTPDEKEEAAGKVIMEDIIQKQAGMLAGALKEEQPE